MVELFICCFTYAYLLLRMNENLTLWSVYTLVSNFYTVLSVLFRKPRERLVLWRYGATTSVEGTSITIDEMETTAICSWLWKYDV